MRKWWEITLLAGLLACSVLILGIGLAGSRHDRQQRKCTGIEISVPDSAENRFLTEADIKKIVDRDFGGYVNRPVDSIRLRKVESILNQEVSIESNEAYITNDGILHINVLQSKPVAKILRGNSLEYMNRHGRFCEVGQDWCESLPSIEDGQKKASDSWSESFGSMAEHLRMSPQWKNRMSSYTIFPNGEIGLHLIDREELFIIGQPCDIDRKLSMINIYEKEIARFSDKKYTTVTVKYTGQIVCI